MNPNTPSISTRLIRVFVMTSLLLGVWSCTSECTEKGCLNTVTFVFNAFGGNPVDGAIGEVTIGGLTVDFDCGPQGGGDGTAYRCVENALIVYANEAPFATIDVTGPTGQISYSGTVNLSFESVFPNGEGCPGECRMSTENNVLLQPISG